MSASLSTILLANGWLTMKLLGIAKTGAEWVLWLLVILGVIATFITVERMLFYKKHKADAQALRQLVISLDGGNIDAAVTTLKAGAPGMEVNVLSYGLQQLDKGGRAVEELMNGALVREIERYDKSLWYLATLGNNAPFIGLFGTVLGVIMAFDALGSGVKPEGGGSAVMGPIAEALIATAVGLLVAIPAVLAFNIFKIRAHHSFNDTSMLSQTMLAFAHAKDAPMIAKHMVSPAKAAGLAKGASPETKKGKALDKQGKQSKMAIPAEPVKAPEAVAAPAAAAAVAMEAATEVEAEEAATEVAAETSGDPATKTDEG